MRVTFRFKLILLVSCAALTVACLVLMSEWRAAQHRREVSKLEQRLVPRIELALKLEAEFVALARSFQDAVAAQDGEGLRQSMAIRERIFALIDHAGLAIDSVAAASLRWKIHDYYETGQTVSSRLIQGQVGEESVHLIARMQLQKREAEHAIQRATAVDRGELGRAFGGIQDSILRTSRLRLTIGVVGLGVLILLWFWASTQMLRGLTSLSRGLSRFATGNFEQPLVITSNDELSDVALDANTMALGLSELALHRDRTDWLKSGQVELGVELRGNLGLDTVAERAAKCLCRRVHALAGAVYLSCDEHMLQLHGHYAYAEMNGGEVLADGPKPVFEVGQGLLGQAFLDAELKVITTLPAHYFQVVSGLGSGPAPRLVLLPITMDQTTIGVVELALVDDLTDLQREYLLGSTSVLFVAFQAAKARSELASLLEETQHQAQRLTAQEEELRLNNQELSAQQEELRQANEELEAQQISLGQRNRELNLARERVQEKVEELGRVSLYKSQFLANMSHELRTPLNSMLLLSHLLSQNDSKNLTDKQVEYCSTIHSAGEDLLELINQVLDLSKIEAGKQEVRHEEVNLSQVATSMRKVFEPLAKEKHLEFSVHIEPESPPSFPSDRLRVERILTNLLGNAIKFTERGKVELVIGPRTLAFADVMQPLDMIAFAVSDTGIGIAADQQERAFRPFEQIEATAARRYQGTGLGLAIARESVGLLGGKIELVSELGKGSTFTCLFPVRLAEGSTLSVEPSQTLEATTTSTSNHPGPLHILVIEDDPILAEQLTAIIEGRGLSVVVAETGELGLSVARQRRPLGIVLDVKLPDVDGWTVMERLKSDPSTNGIPVHFLSALDAPENGLTRGAVGYLTKPATRTELRELIRSLVPEHPTQSQKILVVEDSTIEGQSIVALLKSGDFEAYHVTSAEEALARMDVEAFGCIILDLGLKAMDGLGFLEVLRQRTDFGSISVIVHTGRMLSRKETNRLQEYAQAIVVKDGQSSTRLLEEVRLFVHHLKAQFSRSELPPTQQSTTADVDLTGVHVLLVEDDMRTVYSLSALLQGRGCQVLIAENGRDALAVLEENQQVECVLTDIMMPEMDGYEMMRRLRADGRLKHLPIVALTAKAMAGEQERCLAAGASAYLSKPVDAKKLLGAVFEWTRGGRRVA